MKRYLPFIIVIGVGLITVASAFQLYRAKRPAVLTISAEQTGTKPNEMVHIRGPAKAPVTLEEFGDYQCPPCGMLAGPIKQLEQDYGDKLRVIFRHFPLITHQHAREAACAAEAAGLQGKFWEMHDVLYREQSQWSKTADAQPLFSAYAGMLGLNAEQFRRDMNSEAVKERVSSDQRHGTSIGVQNTPTIFLNNRAVEPSNLAPDKLRAAVNAAIKGASSSSTPAEKQTAK